MSWLTLLTAYGDSGRRGLVSAMGSSPGMTRPYSSLVPTAMNRGKSFRPRIASRRFTCEMMLVLRVSAGVCHEVPTKLCAARCTTQSGLLASTRPRTDDRSRRSDSISVIFDRR
jgi:hypothetical protein